VLWDHPVIHVKQAGRTSGSEVKSQLGTAAQALRDSYTVKENSKEQVESWEHRHVMADGGKERQSEKWK
jgi:hypothetical protein